MATCMLVVPFKRDRPQGTPPAHLRQRGLRVIVGLLQGGQQGRQLRVAQHAAVAAAAAPKPVLRERKAAVVVAEPK
jgi:hypothetical protein